MKKPALATTIATACSAVALAVTPSTPTEGQLLGFPKNIARQHYATTLSIYSATTQKYGATEAAAAWLDDDVATGWPALAGKQHYILQFAEPQIVTNFELSAKSTKGTVSIFAGDKEAAPGDQSWTLVARDVPIEAVNNQKLARPINKYAKCLLIETNIADPGPIYSLNVFGERSAVATAIISRPQAVDVQPILGEFVNNQTAFNMAGLYAKGLVTSAKSAGTNVGWQRAIDDDPETFVSIAPTTGESGMVVRFGQKHPFSRLSLLTNPNARGKVDIFLLSEAPEVGAPVSVEGITPSMTVTFDGTTPRSSVDFAETNAAAMALRWTPESGDAALALREVNIFADLALSNYEVAGAPPVVAKGPEGETTEKTLADGKSLADGKTPVLAGPRGIDNKGMSLPPVLLGNNPGFLPGGPLVPPNYGPPPVSN
jgi:hypothetical protein